MSEKKTILHRVTTKPTITDHMLAALAALFLFGPLILVFTYPPTSDGNIDTTVLVVLIMGPLVSIGLSVISILKQQQQQQ